MQSESPYGEWKDGIILTDAGDFLARPGMTLAALRASPLGNLIEMKGFPPEYPHAVIRPVCIRGYECIAKLIFHYAVLSEVRIEVTDNTARRLSFAAKSSQGADGPESRFLEKWVEQEIGAKPPAPFAWGKVGAIYDGIAGFPSIKFLYRE